MAEKETNNKEANEATQEPLKEVKPATRNSRAKQKPVVIIEEIPAAIEEIPAATEEVTTTETIENDDKKTKKKKMKDKEKKKEIKKKKKQHKIFINVRNV